MGVICTPPFLNIGRVEWFYLYGWSKRLAMPLCGCS